MEPVAYLAFLNLPGENKFKNLKYFLGRGDNVIGSDSRCQIVIPAKYEMPNHIANIRAGYNFITIQALVPHLLYIEGNLMRLQRDPTVDNYFPLAINTQYLPKLDQFFFIGRIKAVIGVLPTKDLLKLKGINNLQYFQCQEQKSKEFQEFLGVFKKQQPKIIQQLSKQNVQNQNQALFKEFEIKIINNKKNNIDEEKSHTEILEQQNYQQEATLLLEEGIYAYQPTIDLNQPIPNGPQENLQPVAYSQQLLLNQIKRQSQSRSIQNNREEEPEDFSMPDTIIDKQNQAHEDNKPHIQLVQSKQQKLQEDENQMPPTILDENISINKIKPTKTMNYAPKIEIQKKLYHSGPLPKDSSNKSQFSDAKPIQDFLDLFGIDPSPSHGLKHQVSQPLGISKEISLGNMSQIKHHSLSDSITHPKKLNQQQRLKVHFVGFKPTAAHREFLKQQSFDIVSHPDEDYDILLVKQPLRISNRLLLALIDGKKIQTQQWIFNRHAEIQTKINNIPWKQIYQKRGTHGLLLRGRGKFYISPSLQQLFQNVIERLGGQLVTQLTEKKRVINVVLRTEDSQDTELYLSHHQNKKWRFLKSEAIIDSIFTGRFNLDEKYLIRLFPR